MKDGDAKAYGPCGSLDQRPLSAQNFAITTGKRFDRDHPSPFGRDLLRRYAIDDAVATHFQLPSFAEWQAPQGRG